MFLNPESTYPSVSMQILEHKEGYVFTPTKETPTVKLDEDIEFIDSPNGDKILLDSKKGEHRKFEYSYR